MWLKPPGSRERRLEVENEGRQHKAKRKRNATSQYSAPGFPKKGLQSTSATASLLIKNIINLIEGRNKA